MRPAELKRSTFSRVALKRRHDLTSWSWPITWSSGRAASRSLSFSREATPLGRVAERRRDALRTYDSLEPPSYRKLSLVARPRLRGEGLQSPGTHSYGVMSVRVACLGGSHGLRAAEDEVPLEDSRGVAPIGPQPTAVCSYWLPLSPLVLCCCLDGRLFGDHGMRSFAG